MKNRILKTICFLLSVALLLSVAACGKDEAKKKPDKKPQTGTSDDTSDVSDPTDIVDEEFDIEGEEDFIIDDGGFDIDTEEEKDDAVITNIKYTVNGIPRAYVTTPNSSVKFRRQNDSFVKVYNKSRLDKSKGTVMEIDANRVYQEIDGFGASLTESSCVNIMDMPENIRTELMTKLFDPQNGIGLSFLRQPLGASDFNLEYYSYDDMPAGSEDWELKNFNIDHDKKQIIPLIKWAQSLNPNMKVLGTVWSPPTWMKTQNEWRSIDSSTNERNKLRLDCYEVYSNYLVKAVKAYKAEGVNITMLSPANEPSAWTQYPGTYYTADEAMRLTNYYLAPAMKAAGLDDIKLICFDDSWDLNRSKDFITKQYGNADILAYHFYGGEASIMKEVHKLFPDVKIYMTETAGQHQAQSQQLFRQVKHFTESFRNYASGWMIWNICLDEEFGPLKNGKVINKVMGTGLTEWNTKTRKLGYQMDFYALAHFSKFIHPGANVVWSTDIAKASDEAYYSIAALNKNGTVTAVLGNQSTDAETFKLVFADKVIEFTVPAESVITVTWDANSK